MIQRKSSEDRNISDLLRTVGDLTADVERLKKQINDQSAQLFFRNEQAFRPHAVDKAKAVVTSRDTRLDLFDRELFGEPGWDILLDLFINEHRGARVAVSDACIAARSPSTTALRWIAVLEEKRYVLRVPDPEDGRRQYLCLTREAHDAMKAWLDQLPY